MPSPPPHSVIFDGLGIFNQRGFLLPNCKQKGDIFSLNCPLKISKSIEPMISQLNFAVITITFYEVYAFFIKSQSWHVFC